MKTRVLSQAVAAVFATVLLGATAPAFAADAHSHGHGAAPQKLTLDHGKKWTTDAPLRTGMQKIRDALAPQLDAIHTGKLPAAQYAALAAAIDAEIAGIVQNCKLPPEADANLHLVIAQMMEGTEAMQGKNPKAKPQTGAVKVVQALDSYAKYFDHPGWKGLKH
jgi:hypothetical protein